MSEHIRIGDIRPRIQYVGNGAVKTFSFPFPIFAESDLTVFRDAAPCVGGFVVNGAGESGGGVTFDAPPSAGSVITLARAVPIARTTDFQDGGTFRAGVINEELDRLVCMAQQLREELDRTVQRAPTSVATGSLTLPDPIPGRALKFAADGALTLSSIDPDAVASAAEASASAAATSAGVASAGAATATTKAAEATGAAEMAVAAEANVAAIAASLPLMNGDGINADHQVTLSENGWVFEATSAAQAIVVTLPRSDEALHPEDAEAGFSVIVQRKGTNTVTVIPHPDDPATVAGVASYEIPDGTGARFTLNETPDPNNWIVTPFGAAVGDAEPIGAIKPFFRVSAPVGYLALNGVDFSAATYPDLTTLVTGAMTALGYTNADAPYFYRHDDLGSPNAARSPTGQYVKMPDWSHRFFRNTGAGRWLGLVEEDAIKDSASRVQVASAAGAATTTVVRGNAENTGVYIPVTGTAAETRPKNVALLWCIKAANAVQTPAEADIAALIAETQETNARVAEINSGGPDFFSTGHSLSASFTVAHGLGVRPVRVLAELVCDVAETGAAAGERHEVALEYPTNWYGAQVVYDAANIQVRRVGNYFFVGTDGVFHPIATPANWHIEVFAWKGSTLTGGARKQTLTGLAFPSVGGYQTIAHTLGAVPSRVAVRARCTSAEYGFAVGEGFTVWESGPNGADGGYYVADRSATSITLGWAPGYGADKILKVWRKDTVGVANLSTATRWVFDLELFA